MLTQGRLSHIPTTAINVALTYVIVVNRQEARLRNARISRERLSGPPKWSPNSFVFGATQGRRPSSKAIIDFGPLFRMDVDGNTVILLHRQVLACRESDHNKVVTSHSDMKHDSWPAYLDQTRL